MDNNLSFLQKNNKKIGIVCIIISIIIVLIILIIISYLVITINRLYNNIDKFINGVWELDNDFANGANLTYGLFVIQKSDNHNLSDNVNSLMYKNYKGSIIFIDGDQIRISEVIQLQLSKLDILHGALTSTLKPKINGIITYLNRKTVVLPEKYINISLNMSTNELMLLGNNNDNNLTDDINTDDSNNKLYGLFHKSSMLSPSSDDNTESNSDSENL